MLDHLDPVLVERADGTPVFANSEYVRLVGPSDPVSGLPSHPVSDEPRRAELRAGGVRVSQRIAWREGRVLRRDYLPVRAGELLVGHVWRYLDVTSEVLAEQRWRASKDRLRELSAHAETAREEERRRLARTLHDELGQRMTSIRLELLSAVDLFRATVTPAQVGIVDRLQAAAGLVDVGIAMLRQLTTTLRPPVLDHLGLVHEVKDERVHLARVGTIEPREGLDGSHAIEPSVDVHGVQQRLIEAGLILLGDNQQLIRVAGKLLR